MHYYRCRGRPEVLGLRLILIIDLACHHENNYTNLPMSILSIFFYKGFCEGIPGQSHVHKNIVVGLNQLQWLLRVLKLKKGMMT